MVFSLLLVPVMGKDLRSRTFGDLTGGFILRGDGN